MGWEIFRFAFPSLQGDKERFISCDANFSTLFACNYLLEVSKNFSGLSVYGFIREKSRVVAWNSPSRNFEAD